MLQLATSSQVIPERCRVTALHFTVYEVPQNKVTCSHSNRGQFHPPSGLSSWCQPQDMCFPISVLQTGGPLTGTGPAEGPPPIPHPPCTLPILQPLTNQKPAPACSQTPVPRATCPAASLTSTAVLQSSSRLSCQGRREELRYRS